jgi:signal transduction histidine kinase
MLIPPIPTDEEARLAAIERYRLSGVGREPAFDHATRFSARLFDVPISLVSIVNATEQCFRGAHGLDAVGTPRDISFCGFAILHDEVMVVEDAAKDPRFFDNPLVTGEPHIRFYAGAPLRLKDGLVPGTLCLIGREPRTFSERQREELKEFAGLVVDTIELRLANIVAEERQQALAQMKDAFVSSTSHELRTPLTSISGSLGLLASGVAGELPERATRLIKIAHSNSIRLVHLVNDILDMEKLASGEVHFDALPVSVENVVSDVVQGNEGYALKHNVRIEIGDMPSGVEVIGDEHRLVQVLTNLVSNAVKFSNEGGLVTLSARERGDAVRITVSDTGRGIPDEFKDRIFTRFAQADASDAREKGGTGLGLSIVKEIVTRMKGDVSFDTALGQGTSFHVDLPKHKEAPPTNV